MVRSACAGTFAAAASAPCRCCPSSPYRICASGLLSLLFSLAARLLLGLTLKAAADAAELVTMPYQRGQFWVRGLRQQAEKLCAALAAFVAPPAAPDFTSRSLQMLASIGWIGAHRFLFGELRVHLLGWPAFLAPAGRIAALPSALPPG